MKWNMRKRDKLCDECCYMYPFCPASDGGEWRGFKEETLKQMVCRAEFLPVYRPKREHRKERVIHERRKSED